MTIRQVLAAVGLALGGYLLSSCSDSAGPTKSQPAPLKFIALAAHRSTWFGGSSCGISADSSLYCWGDNLEHELGTVAGEDCTPPGWSGPTPCSTRPLKVAGAPKVVSLAPGGFANWCALDPAGIPLCWGYILIDGDAGYLLGEAPTALPGGLALSQISSGLSDICGVTPAGEAFCWGDFDMGRRGLQDIGFDTSHATFVPNKVDGGLTFRSVQVAQWNACGLTTDGAVYCWGASQYGALGNPAAPTLDCGYGPCQKVPYPVAGSLTFSTLTSGNLYFCGLTTAGAGSCWGSETDGELGNVSDLETCAGFGGVKLLCATSPVPIEYTAEGPLVLLEAGGATTCEVDSIGETLCFGSNSYGQLGNGGGSGGGVLGGHHFRAFSPGSDHTCALTTDSLAYCWGNNDSGQLGDGTTQDMNEPVAVAGPASP